MVCNWWWRFRKLSKVLSVRVWLRRVWNAADNCVVAGECRSGVLLQILWVYTLVSGNVYQRPVHLVSWFSICSFWSARWKRQNVLWRRLCVYNLNLKDKIKLFDFICCISLKLVVYYRWNIRRWFWWWLNFASKTIVLFETMRCFLWKQPGWVLLKAA